MGGLLASRLGTTATSIVATSLIFLGMFNYGYLFDYDLISIIKDKQYYSLEISCKVFVL